LLQGENTNRRIMGRNTDLQKKWEDQQRIIKRLRSHDLWQFWKEANARIVAQYEKLRQRAAKQPNTVGDQGEHDWKHLLEQWIPRSYKMVTKGRLLFEDGQTSPELDLIVLKPAYPEGMLGHKYYLADGVAAAFECKRTLEPSHIDEAIADAKSIQSKLPCRTGDPRKEMYGPIVFGLLAHTHCWKNERSTPIDNIDKRMKKTIQPNIYHPRELLDIVCIGDLASWLVWKTPSFFRRIHVGYHRSVPLPGPVSRFKSAIAKVTKVDTVDAALSQIRRDLRPDDALTVLGILLGGHHFNSEPIPSVGFAVCGIIEMLAWEDESIRGIARLLRQYRSTFAYSNPELGNWDYSLFSDEVAKVFTSKKKSKTHFGRNDWNPWICM
jgi:hypothetical protein